MSRHTVTVRDARRLAANYLGVPEAAVHVTRVTEGVSTWVFRARYGGDTFYLRVLPEAGASFAPEVAAHRELRRRGVQVPDIIAFTDAETTTRHSVMLTTAIAGEAVSATSLGHDDARAIFMAAGRDLARINSVPVAGFGWVRRDQPDTATIAAAWPTQRAWALEHWEADLAMLARGSLQPNDIAALHRLRTHYDGWMDSAEAVLAHGDFDTTHIFQRDGHYSGIIDFGEIRGTDRWYDLGHFHAHDGERLPYAALPDLLRGYGEMAPLPSDTQQRVQFAALLITVRAVARVLPKHPANRYSAHLLQVLRATINALH